MSRSYLEVFDQVVDKKMVDPECILERGQNWKKKVAQLSSSVVIKKKRVSEYYEGESLHVSTWEISSRQIREDKATKIE